MNIDLKIRKLVKEETDAALSLVLKVFSEYEAPDYTGEGINEFRKSIYDDDYLKELVFYGAFDSEKLIGVLATRNCGNHIALFFVLGEYQKQGVGKALFRAAYSACTEDRMTVNSSPFAVPFYHAFDFFDTDSEQEQDGIRYTPMALVLRDSNCLCKRKKCERHGNCMACRSYHKTEKKTEVYCERIRKKAQRKTEHADRKKNIEH